MKYLTLFVNNMDKLPNDCSFYDKTFDYDPWQDYIDFQINKQTYRFIDNSYTNLSCFYPDLHNIILCVDSLGLYKKFSTRFPTRYFMPLPIEIEEKSNTMFSDKRIYVFNSVIGYDIIPEMFKYSRLKGDDWILVDPKKKIIKKFYKEIYYELYDKILKFTDFMEVLSHSSKVTFHGMFFSESIIFKNLEKMKKYLEIESNIIDSDTVEYYISREFYKKFNYLKSIPKGYFEKYILPINPIYDIDFMFEELILGEVI